MILCGGEVSDCGHDWDIFRGIDARCDVKMMVALKVVRIIVSGNVVGDVFGFWNEAMAFTVGGSEVFLAILFGFLLQRFTPNTTHVVHA